jgi:hypothetical protein
VTPAFRWFSRAGISAVMSRPNALPVGPTRLARGARRCHHRIQDPGPSRLPPVEPVASGRRLLDAFCPVCLHGQAGLARAAVPAPAAALRTLEEALVIGATCCAAGVRPCVQGPVRLAGLVRLLRVHPAAAAASLARMETSLEGNAEPVIHPDRLWVRACLSCGIPSVTDARDHAHFCRRHVPRSA